MHESSREFRPDLSREFEYLLGHMPRVDRETYQGVLIENSEASERVLEAEYELFDAYLRGDLPGEWRPAFESRLLATGRGQRKLALAKRLMGHKTAAQPRRRTLWLSIAGAAAVALIAGFWPSPAGGGVQSIVLGPEQQDPRGKAVFTVESRVTLLEFAVQASSAELQNFSGRSVWNSSAPPPFRVPAELVPSGRYRLTTFVGSAPSGTFEFEIIRK